MSAFRTFGNFLITMFDTTSMGFVALNHLARAGVERTVVVEQKSVQAAALSEYEGKVNFALRLQEIEDSATDLDEAVKINAENFLKEYEERRSKERIAQPIRLKAITKKRGRKKTSAKKS